MWASIRAYFHEAIASVYEDGRIVGICIRADIRTYRRPQNVRLTGMDVSMDGRQYVLEWSFICRDVGVGMYGRQYVSEWSSHSQSRSSG